MCRFFCYAICVGIFLLGFICLVLPYAGQIKQFWSVLVFVYATNYQVSMLCLALSPIWLGLFTKMKQLIHITLQYFCFFHFHQTMSINQKTSVMLSYDSCFICNLLWLSLCFSDCWCMTIMSGVEILPVSYWWTLRVIWYLVRPLHEILINRAYHQDTHPMIIWSWQI